MNGQPLVDPRGLDFAAGAARPATMVDVNVAASQIREDDKSPTWVVRGANFVVATTSAKPNTRLVRADQVDEYMLYVPPGAEAVVNARGESIPVEADSLTIIPPGASEIVSRSAAYFFRIFSNRAQDLVELSSNNSTYGDDRADVAPLVDWPAPVGGYRTRTYPMKGIKTGDAFGRIYRSSNLMVNIFEPYTHSRDQSALSPHSHVDFEQGSLTLEGHFEHYLRTPWGKDRGAWRDDVTFSCDSPSVTVIPSGMIHTTAWIGARGRMIDIFSPPRADFSARDGWVRNEIDYPAPRPP